MKKTLILLSILTSFVASAQSIEINPNGGTNASAVLDLKSTTKGFLPPRMTGEQMRAISSPAQGLLAFCTDCGTTAIGEYYFYKGTAWVLLSSTTISSFTSIGAVSDVATPQGASVTSDGVLNLAPANATNPGIVTKTDQTFGGVKTFSNGIIGNVTGNLTGNAATVTTNANLTGVVTSTGNATSIGSGAITNAMLANGAVANLTGINSGDQTTITGNAGTATKIASITNSDIVQLTSTQTLTNKTLTSPTITGTGAIAGTFTGNLTGNVSGDVTGNVTGNAGTATKIASITNSDIVQLTSTQTLTNKTLTSPTITGTGAIAGIFTGDLTGNVTGNASTVTTNANLTGDVTSIGNAATVVKINGTSLSGLPTGILKNTTATGVPTIATAGTDYQLPITLTTTGSGAATLSSNTLNIPNVSYTLPTATSSTLGGVKIDGTSIIINPEGVLSVTPASIGAQVAGSYLTSSTGVTTFNGSTTGLTPASATSGAVTLGGVLVGANGGTGVNNTGKTITLGGNLTTSGAFNTELTTTASTTITLPVSGTLATLAGVETFANKVLTSPVLTTPALGTPSAAILTNATGLPLTDGVGVTGVLPVAYGGTGSSTKNFVDLTTDQTIAGGKTFSSDLTVNGLTVGKGRSGISTNTAVGASALSSNTTGFQNTANGVDALFSNKTGENNTATGYQALYSNTTEPGVYGIIFSGNNNTANGFQALYSNTTGVVNTANGASALYSNTTGFGNTANGVDALSSNTTGFQNTAIGVSALRLNTTGSENTANGEYALYHNTTGILNTANGFGALFDNNTGSKNTAYGLSALTSNITGSNNTAIGYEANVASDNLENATAIGNEAIVSASHKIQLGNAAVTAVQLGTDKVILETSRVKITGGTPGDGKVLTSDANGLASWATSSAGIPYTGATAAVNLGAYDLTVNGLTVGKGRNRNPTNTAIGVSALSSNTDGYSNTAIGESALILNTTGYGNTANGTNALYVNTTGYYNTATGGGALNFNTTGYENTATGVGALILNTTGTKNTAIGLNALKNNTTGSNNTAIGYNADVSSSDLTNATAIGNGATVGASHKVRIGNASVTVIEGQVAWSNVSDRRLKENIQVNNYLGLNFINKLQPVTYNYISGNTKVMHDGFIAQDIEQVMKDLNMPFSGLKKSSDGMYSLAYSDFVMPMVNAIKEQKTIIDNQQKQIDELKKMVESLLKK